jgi:hypothetical protein
VFFRIVVRIGLPRSARDFNQNGHRRKSIVEQEIQ